MSRSDPSGKLRRRAEDRVAEDPTAATRPGTEADLTRLVHELQVHKVELELQYEELRRATEEVQASSARYADLYDFAPVGYFRLDRDGTIRGANLRGADVLGMERSRLLGRRFGHFVADEARHAFDDFLGRIFAGEGTDVCEVLLAPDDGQTRHVRVEATVPGSGIGCLAAVIDITDRKRAEETARQQNATLESVNKILGAALTCESERDLGLACLEIAQELTQSKFGFIGEVNEQGLEDIAISNPGWDACGVVDARGHRVTGGSFTIHGLYGRVLSDGTPLLTNDPAGHPDRIGLPAGHPPLAAFLGVPLIRGGRTVGLLAVANRPGGYGPAEQETLEALAPAVVEALLRKRAEEALRESELKYRAFFDNSIDAVLLTAPDGSVYEANPEACRIFGRTREEILRLGRQSLVDRSDPRLQVALEERARTGRFRGEIAYIRKDGTTFPGEVSTALFADVTGKTLATMIIRDVTERKQAEDALREAKVAADAANRAKSEFLARMSHEIRTPMNGVMGMTELVLMDEGLPQRAREFLGLAKQSARGLLEIINDILDLARIEAGRVELQERPFELAASSRDLLTPLRIAAERKGLRLNYHFASGIPTSVIGDEGRLRQVLTNLVGNAVKFTERGEVKVSARVSGEPAAPGRARVLFAVEDEGIGIPPESLRSIFDAFSQATRSTHAKYGGTGLGLSIAKQLVELMGGRIWGESQPGKGSRFQFTAEFALPEAGTSHPASEPSGFALASGERLRVLVAEDNPMNQIFAEELLKRLGHEAVLVADGEEALRALSRKTFDVVLMDVQMPGMNGDEATTRIRAGLVEGCPSNVPIVALTAHAIHGDRERFLGVGMDDYLSKPFDPDTLNQVLWRVVKREREA